MLLCCVLCSIKAFVVLCLNQCSHKHAAGLCPMQCQSKQLYTGLVGLKLKHAAMLCLQAALNAATALAKMHAAGFGPCNFGGNTLPCCAVVSCRALQVQQVS